MTNFEALSNPGLLTKTKLLPDVDDWDRNFEKTNFEPFRTKVCPLNPKILNFEPMDQFLKNIFKKQLL